MSLQYLCDFELFQRQGLLPPLSEAQNECARIAVVAETEMLICKVCGFIGAE
jgi:hypothetical protein